MITHSKPWIIDADRYAVDTVLAGGLIAQGEHVRELERECARYLSTADAVAVGSGTAALILALRALQLTEGAEIILPTYVCRNVVEAVITVGCSPVLCDVGDTWNVTVELVGRAMSRRTGAIIIVHTFGIPVDTQRFQQFGVPIVDDACQAFGASLGGHMSGTVGEVGVFSFHATKCLTTGEGGLAVSNNRQLVERMRALRDGRVGEAPRIASPMSDLEAALGRSQLGRYGEFLNRRRELARVYLDELADCAIDLPWNIRETSIFFRFPIRLKRGFEAFRECLAGQGIQVRRGVDSLLHWTVQQRGRGFANAELLFAETASLPIYPALTMVEQEKIIEVCRRFSREEA
jgi:UDP-4-amino-4-deoxy-L-arabinose-oxoglutarate aminotransferase